MRTGEVRKERATATFCCWPRERWLIGWRARPAPPPRRARVGAPPPPRPPRRTPPRRLAHHVVAEGRHLAGVRQEQGADDPDQRRLAGAVGADDAVYLAARDGKGNGV